MQISFDPEIQLPGAYPKGIVAHLHKYSSTRTFVEHYQEWKQPYCPSTED